MSDIVGEAVLRIRTDDSDVNRGITSAGKKGGEGYSKGFKDGLKGLAGAAGLAFGADKAVDFLKSGIEAATSFQDETGALNVIIGKEGTAAVQKFSETSAKAFGISKVQALEASHTFATFGKSAGLSGKGLGDFSVKFASLAGDLASFNGGSTEDAITAIGAALRGETEPIRRYGVLLDDMSLRQEAVRQGIIKNIKTALTPQQRVLAAQALIFKQTKDAQGDFARTSDSAANSQKALTAKMADLRLEIGTKLLPVETKVVQALSEFITQMEDGTGAGGEFVDVLKETAAVGKAVFDFFNGLPGPVKKYGIELLIAAVAISKLNSGLGSLSSGIGTYTTNLRNAETRSARFSAGLQGLGGALRNVAGAGGLLLLADSTKKADTNMGFLEATAGGALSGGALGAFAGPPGAAVGAAIGSLAGATFALTREQKGLEKSTAIVTGSYKEYESTLSGVTAATTAQTRATAFDRLEKSGLLQATRALGLSDREAVSAVLGQTSARRDLARQLENNHTLTDAQRKALERETGAVGAARLEQLRHNVVIADSAADLRKARTALKNFMAEPASKRVAITGVELAAAKINNLRALLRSFRHDLVSVDSQLSATPPKSGLGGLLGGNQSGTDDWRGGFSKVGETGPEIVWMPKHAQVTSAPRTQQLLARTGAGSGPSAQDIGVAVTKALVAAGVSGATIVNPVPEMASVSQARVSANTAFLLGG